MSDRCTLSGADISTVPGRFWNSPDGLYAKGLVLWVSFLAMEKPYRRDTGSFLGHWGVPWMGLWGPRSLLAHAMCRPQDNLGCCSSSAVHHLFETRSLTAWHSTHRIGWLASEPRNPPVLPPKGWNCRQASPCPIWNFVNFGSGESQSVPHHL